MTRIQSIAPMVPGIVLLACGLLFAQVQKPGEYPRGVEPSPMMNFFVTSETMGDGGNLGGLAGADAHCQTLATAVGAGNRTWHRAFLLLRDKLTVSAWMAIRPSFQTSRVLGPSKASIPGQVLSGPVIGK